MAAETQGPCPSEYWSESIPATTRSLATTVVRESPTISDTLAPWAAPIVVAARSTIARNSETNTPSSGPPSALPAFEPGPLPMDT
jgi:hypothetical protein